MRLASLPMSLVVAALGLLGTGCWGASTAGSTTETHPPPKPPPPTRLTVSYAVGYGDRLGACPRGAACATRRLDSSNLRVRVALFTISCNPPAGSYRDPRAACAAAANYIKQRSRLRHHVCMCPFEVYRDTITGTFRGRHVDLPIGPCSVCGMGRAADHDAAVLLPSR
jgi:hypothetical protein